MGKPCAKGTRIPSQPNYNQQITTFPISGLVGDEVRSSLHLEVQQWSHPAARQHKMLRQTQVS
jgi:hypothetical protein